MKNTFRFLLTLILVSTLYLSNTFSQYPEYTQLGLPEGVKARLGKGWISGEIAYSPDGTRLAVSSSIGIWIYDANTFDEVALFTGHTEAVNSVAFSPNGKMLASGSEDETVKLWDVHTGQLLSTLDEHTSGVTSVAFSPDGKMFASGSYDYTARLWDTDTGQLLHTFRMVGIGIYFISGSAAVNSVAFSPNGKTLATGDRYNGLRLWDVDAGTLLADSGGGNVRSVAFSSDGITLATGQRDRSVKLWGARTGKFWQTVGNHGRSTVNSVAFSPDGKMLASGGNDKKIKLWDAFTGEYLRELEGHTNGVLGLSFSPDGQTIASVSWTEVRFWNTDTGRQKHIVEGHTRTVNSVNVSPDGKTLASGHQGPALMLWDTHSGQNKHTFIPYSDRWRSSERDNVYSVVFSPDSNKLIFSYDIYGHGGSELILWNTHTLKPLQSFSQGVSMLCTAFSPDGNMIAGAWNSNSAVIHLRDAETGEMIHTLNSGMDRAYSIAFSPDGNILAIGGSGNRTIQLWHVRTGRRLQTPLDKGNIYSVAFSPDGSTLASGGADNRVRLWNPRSGELLHTLEGHNAAVLSITFSPDGNILTSASWRGMLFWEPHTGERVRTLVGHTGWISSVTFSPDGNTLVSGSHDGTILLWELAPSDTPDATPSTPTTSDATVSISATPVQAPAIGELLTFPLNITNGENVAGYQATVQFDTTALQYVSSENGDYLPQGAFFVPPVVEGNKVTLAASSLARESNGDGTLATLTFELVTAETSTLTLSEVSLVDSDGTRSYPNIEENTQIEIIEASYPPEDINEDGVVNILDLVAIASNFGETGHNSADVNEDGVVDIVDLVLVAGAIGNTISAPSVWDSDLEVVPTRTEVQQWLTQAQRLNLTDATSRQGIFILERLLAALTPKETALLPNYPNPFNPETWIPYQLAKAAEVKISIYAADGKLIRTLNLGHQSIGIYQGKSRAAYWDGRNALGERVASGVYFYQLETDAVSFLRKMVILK